MRARPRVGWEDGRRVDGTAVNVYFEGEARLVIERATGRRDGTRVRALTAADVPMLADLYQAAYDPAMSIDDAVTEMESAFDGTWGALWPDASLAAWIGDHMVAVVQTVRRPSWDETRTCPWIIEVFTHPNHRREGRARSLLGLACQVVSAAGELRIGLTVDDANAPAVALYRSIGFTQTD
jgi:GNAT superfamily N-acetyltransferase